MTAENIENIEREREIVAHLADCPWFLVSGQVDGRWWWANVADRAMHREWGALMRECDEWRNSPGASRAENAEILASWSLDDAVGASSTVSLGTGDGYIADQDGPCTWDRSHGGSPPPWWSEGMPAELVRRVNSLTFRIARAHYGWTYGPAQREYYGR